MQRLRRALVATLVAAAVLVIAPTPVTAQATTDEVIDLIFAVDGSGSIDAADWEIQRTGIATALRDPATVPTDGTVAVGVVQWTTSAQTEIPLQVVASTAVAEDLASQVETMSQIGGGTSPDQGLIRSTNEFGATQRTGASQVICMSTDGTGNHSSTIHAASGARDAGVETYSVIAIEDPGAFDEQDAHDYYGPAVFTDGGDLGSGSVTVTRNATEFASIVANACFPSELELVALEANQVIQNWSNDIPLFAGKDTVIRAFVESLTGEAERVTGRLRGFQGGTELPNSPLAASNPGGSVFATSDNADRRDERDASLNFVLPDSWLSGSVQLVLEVPGGLQCSEVAPPAGQCKVDVTFNPSPSLELRMVDIPWDDGAGNSGDLSYSDLVEQGRRVEDAFPVADLDVEYRYLVNSFDAKPDEGDVITRLKRARAADGCGASCEEFYYGAIEGNGGGLADDIPSYVSTGFVDGVLGSTDTGYARNRGAHEVAHSLGIPHAVDATGSGACGSGGSRSTPFPYQNTVDGTLRSTLSDLGDPATEIWGIAPRFRSGPEDLFIVSPYEAFELMDYCKNAGSHWRWPSRDTYDRLITGLGSSATSTSAIVAAAAADRVLVTGSIDTATDGVSIDPLTIINVDDAPHDTEGSEYTLELHDESGGVLASASFTPEAPHGDVPSNSTTEPTTDPQFLLSFADPGPVGAIVVTKGGTEVLNQSASANAPDVEITTPSAGQVFDQPTVTFEWSASDADGDPLTFLVQYRPSDTDSWTTLAADYADTTLTVDRDQLEGSTTAQLRVVASDGMRTDEDVSDTFFTVNDNAPMVSIVSPADNDAFSGVQAITFEADADDPEDGELDGTDVTWSSDVDGNLGTGAQLLRTADQLQEGTHVITVTATDSQSQSVTDTVTIEVVRVATPTPPPPPGGGGGGEVPAPPVAMTRLAGSGRIGTALRISQDQWADQDSVDVRSDASTAVLVRSDEFADALTGTPLAHRAGGPLLLTASSSLAPEVLAEIQRILPSDSEVLVIGGTAAIEDDVLDDLRDAGYVPKRIAGPTRYGTAVAINEELGNPDQVLLATGHGFADGVTAGTAAAHIDSGVLLTDGDEMHPVTAAYLAAHDPTTVAVGGPAATAAPDVEALVGMHRYETGVLVAERFFTSNAAVGLGTGATFADTLAGGARMADLGGPVLLTPTDELHPTVAAHLQSVADRVEVLMIFGGTAAVGATVASQAAEALE